METLHGVLKIRLLIDQLGESPQKPIVMVTKHCQYGQCNKLVDQFIERNPWVPTNRLMAEFVHTGHIY